MIRIDLHLSPTQLGRLVKQLGEQGSDSEEKDALYDALYEAHKRLTEATTPSTPRMPHTPDEPQES